MRENDLSDSLIERAKALLLMKNEEHPFGRLENHALLKEMNLSGINYETGERGLRRLAGLLFGKDMTLRNLFANTAVTCERQVDGETQRLNMETNLLDEAEKLIRFLQPAAGEEAAKAFSSVEENIRVRIRQKSRHHRRSLPQSLQSAWDVSEIRC